MLTSFLRNILSGAVVTAALTANAEIDLGYYSSLVGLSGEQLKTATHKLISSNMKAYSYGSGTYATWWCFYITDRDVANNTVVDRYSQGTFYFGERGKSVSGMNIEHSFPKSWWGSSTSVNAYKDLYNLMPCESGINNTKQNYSMGVVATGDKGNGFTKVGKDASGTWVWEPADKWKGVFARGYMYMATAYQNLTWSGSAALASLVNGDYPTLQPWASTLYIKWAKEHPIREEETTRNQTVSNLQGNRNPYVDFPNLMEYVWGDSIDQPFEPLTTVKVDKYFGIPDGNIVELISADYKIGENGCTPSSAVWKLDTSYGWKAAARNTKATLTTEVIDLSDRKYASANFSHTVNYCTDPASYLSLSVKVEGEPTVTPVTIPIWPSGSDWTFLNSGQINLTPFCGKKIQLVFNYSSDANVTPTWEIASLKLTAQGKFSGVETIPVDLSPENADSSMPIEYYSIDGRRINPDNYRGIAIRRQGSRASKILLK